MFDFIDLAIEREKQLKGLSRAKKDKLINTYNPNWMELYQKWKNNHKPEKNNK